MRGPQIYFSWWLQQEAAQEQIMSLPGLRDLAHSVSLEPVD
jgi:hypothetical protein